MKHDIRAEITRRSFHRGLAASALGVAVGCGGDDRGEGQGTGTGSLGDTTGGSSTGRAGTQDTQGSDGSSSTGVEEDETTGGPKDTPVYLFTFNAIPFPSVPFADQTEADTEAHLIFPRPNSETGTYARQRWAHDSFDYQVPVCVRGGRWPYRMTVDPASTAAALVDAISVGVYGAQDEYRVTIPAAVIANLRAGADYDICIKVTDQDGDELRVQWSLQREANALEHFFFVDNSGPNGDGSFASPFNTINEPGWLEGGNGAQSAQKILVLKQGDSLTTPYPKSAGWNFSGANFPAAIINIPGEQPVVDCQDNFQMWGWGGQDSSDGFFAGFRAVNGDTAYEGGGFRGAFASEFSQCWQRALIWNCEFDTVAQWPLSNQNSSFIMFNNCSGGRKHVAIVGNTFRNSAGGPTLNEGAVCMLDGLQYFMLDDNVVENFGSPENDVGSLVFSKRNVSDGTVRRFTAVTGIYAGSNENGFGLDFRLNNLAQDTLFAQNMEITRNNLNFDGNAQAGIQWIRNNATFSTPDGPWYCYYNTVRGAAAGTDHDDSCATVLDVRSNVSTAAFATDVEGPNGGAACPVPSPTLTDNREDVAADDFNADGTLVDGYLAREGLMRGEVGHELG